MATEQKNAVQMSIDTKKFRIRIHKECLHLIGNPQYVQLLVDVDSRHVAIRAVEREMYTNQAHRVDRARMESDSSVEIYSRLFISTLQCNFDCFAAVGLYRLFGLVLPDKKVAVFSLSSVRLY